MDYDGAVMLHFSRELAQQTTVATAVVYDVLYYREKHWKENLNEDGEFYSSISSIVEYTGMAEKTVLRAIKDLEELGLITRRTSYRPGTSTKTTFWQVHKLTKCQFQETDKMSASILKGQKEKQQEEVDDDFDTDIIPLADPTTKAVEVETFDSDDNGKCIVVKRRIPRKYWNSAVRKWRKDPNEFARVEFEDEPGKVTSIRPSQLKSWNVRPKIGGSVNQYNGGTAFQG